MREFNDSKYSGSRRKIRDLLQLSGRKAFVVGGAGNIGLSAVETLVELGAWVAVADLPAMISRQEFRAVAGFEESRSFGIDVDLLSEESARKAVREAAEQMGGLDIFIHSAGYVGTTIVPGWAAPFLEQGVAAWDAAMRVNLTSAFIMAQESANFLSESGHGSIILISSMYGMVGPDMSLYEGTEMNNAAGYNASKGGMLQLTRYLATLLAPRVRTNATSPGGVWRNQPEAFHQRYKARTPLKRMAVEEDLKGAVAYLASDLSAYVTGHNLVVDGGWTIW